MTAPANTPPPPSLLERGAALTKGWAALAVAGAMRRVLVAALPQPTSEAGAAFRNFLVAHVEAQEKRTAVELVYATGAWLADLVLGCGPFSRATEHDPGDEDPGAWRADLAALDYLDEAGR